MRILTATALLVALTSGSAPARSETTAGTPVMLAHTGYTIEYPRGCKLVFSTVRVNGVDVVLRQVKCPNSTTPSTS